MHSSFVVEKKIFDFLPFSAEKEILRKNPNNGMSAKTARLERHLGQGDQICFEKIRPKCVPTYFRTKSIHM
jgi:hypothetical protein